ncbi:hypothetical protein LJC46_00575 [Desulfovibrio sp. OttesenSCG-928-G15]|nr:hypothetical protein [Desulfovibrio sp. OttesenSCG-928-G15]
MKKIIALALVAMFASSSGAFAALVKRTFTGVIVKDPTEAEAEFNSNPVYFLETGVIPGNNDEIQAFRAKDLKDTSPEFRKCITDNKYKKVVRITAKLEKDGAPDFLTLDKTSTCKRIDGITPIPRKSETFTGKVKKCSDSDYSLGSCMSDAEPSFTIKELKNTTKEFQRCIKAKGKVSITATPNPFRQSIELMLDEKSVCKRH